MAPLSFLKSSSTSGPSKQPESPAPPQDRNRSPSPEPSTASRYNPARLLRRRPSSSRKPSPQPPRKLSESQAPLPGMVSAASEVESSEQETEGPQTASSAFFSDIGDHHVNPSGLGFEGSTGLGGNRGMEDGPGGDASGFSPSRILGSPRSKREGGIWSGGGTNIMDRMPDMGDKSAPPAWLSNAASPTGSRRIMDPSELLVDELTEAGPSRRIPRPSTPPSPSSITGTTQTYPTALSPPRRPMPKSPQSSRSTPPPLAPALSTSSSFSAFPPDKRFTHAPSPSLDVPSIPRPVQGHRSTSSQGSGSIVESKDEPRKPVVTAEWLARKPSSSRSKRNDSTGGDTISKSNQTASPFAKRRVAQKSRTRPEFPSNDSDSQDFSHDSDMDVNAGFLPKRKSLNTRAGYEVEVTCDDSQWSVENEEEGETSWTVTIRRPKHMAGERSTAPPTNGSAINPSSPLQLSTGKSMATAPGTASSINLSLSLDQPTGKLVFIAFPMDLHATPKRRESTTKHHHDRGAFTPPPVPSPRDLFSAAASRSHSSSANGSAPSTRDVTPPPLPTATSEPHTPPPALPSTPQSRSASRLDRPEYPVTPTRVRLSGQFSPGPGSAGNFTSPRSRGSSSIARSLSPAFSGGTPGNSGNGLITPGTYSTPTSAPRRTRLVNAPDLEGGLYARGTVDDMSEELEGVSISPR
jgi:hypothetical protein